MNFWLSSGLSDERPARARRSGPGKYIYYIFVKLIIAHYSVPLIQIKIPIKYDQNSPKNKNKKKSKSFFVKVTPHNLLVRKTLFEYAILSVIY